MKGLSPRATPHRDGKVRYPPLYDLPPHTAQMTWIFALAAALLLPPALAYARAGAPLRHFQFGLFQPALLALAPLHHTVDDQTHD